MSIKRLFVLLSLAAVLTLSACSAVPIVQAADEGKPVVRQLSTVGQGKVYLVPDLAYVYIGVRSEAATVAEALKLNNTQAQAIQKALTDLGVDVKDIQTSAFNVYPQQQVNPREPNATETKTTYVVENTVNVNVRDLSKLGGLLDKVVESGANTINGIQFDVKDKAKALSEARKQAIDDAKAQAAELAQAAGVTLGAIQTMNVYTGGQPGPVYQGKGGFAVAADSSVPVSAGQLLVTADANITFEIK